MHPAREAEDILLRDTTEAERETALIWALLALGQAVENLGHDIRESGRDIATEVGGISVTLDRKS